VSFLEAGPRPRVLVFAAAVTLLLAGWLALGATRASATHNDAFANAVELFGDLDNDVTDNIGATKQAGEPNHAGNAGGASVWWKWTAPANGTALVDTCPSDFDTLLGVYVGSSVSSLTEVASDDDACGLGTSITDFPAFAGVTYYFAVDGFGGDTGTIDILVELFRDDQPQPPPNDNRAAAELIPGPDHSVVRDNFGATVESDEVTTCNDPEATPGGVSVFGGTVWFLYDPPSPGRAVFEVSGGGQFDPVLTVYRADGTPLGCDDDTGDLAGLSRMAVNYGGPATSDPTPRLVQIGEYVGFGGSPFGGTFTYSVSFDPARRVNSRLRYKVGALNPGANAFQKFSRIFKLKLSIDANTSALVRCLGKGCPFDEFTTAEAVTDLESEFRKDRAKKGTKLEIYVTREGDFGTYYRLKFQGPKGAKLKEMCIESLSSAGEPQNLFAC
jgi:hypothetical protein